jgi:thiaminase
MTNIRRSSYLQAYFEAWSYAKSHFNPDLAPQTETQKALAKFIDNWTCEEFQGFVKHSREVVDGLELEKDQELLKGCEDVSPTRCLDVTWQ